jgi:hypothetical protein
MADDSVATQLRDKVKLLCCLFIPPALDQDVQYVAILIHCAPKVTETSVDLEEHFVEMPYVAGTRRLVT